MDFFIKTSKQHSPQTDYTPVSSGYRDQLKGVETGTCSSDVSHSSLPFLPEQFLECE